MILNHKTSYGILYHAIPQIIEIESIEILKEILNHPTFDINKACDMILWAIRGKPKSLKILLKDKRIDPNKKGNDYFQQALVQEDNVKVIRLLLKDGRCNPCEAIDHIMNALFNYKEKYIIEFLKDGRISLNIDKNVIHNFFPHEPSVEFLQLVSNDSRIDLSFDCNFFLDYCCSKGWKESIKILLKDVNVLHLLSKHCPLITVLESKSFDILWLFMNNKYVDITKDDQNLLRQACYNGYLKLVSKILQHEQTDFSDLSKIGILECLDNKEWVILKEIIRNHNVDLTMNDHTMVDIIIISNNVPNTIIKYILLKKDINPNYGEHRLLTMLIYIGNIKMIKCLLNHPKFVYPSELLLDIIYKKCEIKCNNTLTIDDKLTNHIFEKIQKVINNDPRNSKWIRHPKKRINEIIENPITKYFFKKKTNKVLNTNSINPKKRRNELIETKIVKYFKKE